MKIPVDKLTRAFKMGASVKKDSDTPVRVSVYLDSSASRFLAETVRDAFVPQTTSGIVRVERLGEERIAPKTDTDVVLVLSCGSDRLESAVQELVIAGAPCACLPSLLWRCRLSRSPRPCSVWWRQPIRRICSRRLPAGFSIAPTRKRLLRRTLPSCASRRPIVSSPRVRSPIWRPGLWCFCGHRLSRYGAGAGGHAL